MVVVVVDWEMSTRKPEKRVLLTMGTLLKRFLKSMEISRIMVGFTLPPVRRRMRARIHFWQALEKIPGQLWSIMSSKLAWFLDLLLSVSCLPSLK